MDEETLRRIEKVIFRAATDTVDELDCYATVFVAQRKGDETLRIAGKQFAKDRLFDVKAMDEVEEKLKARIQQELDEGHGVNWPQILVQADDEEVELAITMAIEKALEGEGNE